MIETSLQFIRQASEPVGKDENLNLLFGQLESELANSQVPGVGLAAIQIGIPKQAAIVKVEGGQLVKIWNPKVLELDAETIVSPEGCLSLPGVHRSVLRRKGVLLENGDGRRLSFYGFEAIVVQHELCHMEGKTILDMASGAVKVGRNDLCPCGQEVGGKRLKYKKCHYGREIELQQFLIGRA